MNPIQIIQSIVKKDRILAASGFSFKPGQLIHGRVEKLFPHNMALVQIGNMKLYAQIEVALEAMGNYWFEVGQSEQENIHLKVIENKFVHNMNGSNSLRTLLNQFQLPETKQNLGLIEHLLSKNQPFTKEQLVQSSRFIKGKSDITKGLSAIELMIKKDFPFTDDTFKSMVTTQGSQAIVTELDHLSKWLENTKLPQLDSVIQLRDHVSKLVGKLTLEQTQRIIQELSKAWLSPVSSVGIPDTALRLLQRLEIIPGKLSREQAISTVFGDLIPALSETISFTKINEQQAMIDKTMQMLSNSQLHKSSQLLNDLFMNTAILSQEEESLLKQLREQISPLVKLDSGQDVKNMLKQITASLGLEYEKEIAAWVKTEENSFEKMEGLKPLLLKAMNDLGAGGRELESFVNRITGLQLQSQETNGPLQQILMHIPLTLGTKQTDLTLQWSGRKKEDGKIDPSYCRILFYLDLEQINQTIVDMQVQNRIISVTVMNDKENLDSIVNGLGQALKEQLGKLNYHLSSIKVVASLQKTKTFGKSISSSFARQTSYQGVDLKV